MSNPVFISKDSDTTVDEMRPFIGRTVSEIHASESAFIIKFTDGSKIYVNMRWNGLSIDGYEHAEDKPQ